MYQQSIFSTKGNTFDSFKPNAQQKSTFLKLVFNAIHQEWGGKQMWRPPYDAVATAIR